MSTNRVPPDEMTDTVALVIKAMGIHKTANLWDTVLRAVLSYIHVLGVTDVVVIYRERGCNKVQARKIARDSPPFRPWGVEFQACATEGCNPRRVTGFFTETQGSAVRMTCRQCGWKSAWVNEENTEGLVMSVGEMFPDVFWHEYPVSPALASLFVTITAAEPKDQ